MVGVKTAIDKKQATEVLTKFLEKFQTVCNQQKTPQTTEFERILSNNFENFSNGTQTGRTIQEFLKRIEGLQKKYSNIKINPRKEVIVGENKAVTLYDVDLTPRSGEKFQLTVIAVATIEDGVITHWTQVSHEKGEDHFRA